MITITYADIKEMLVNKYCGTASIENQAANMNRELVVHTTPGNKKDVVLWLHGSPPKGYCIAGNAIVSLYDLNGKRFKIFTGAHAVPDDMAVC